MGNVNVANVLSKLTGNKKVIVSNPDEQRAVSLLMSLGDVQFANVDAELNSNGSLTLSLCGSKTCPKTSTRQRVEGEYVRTLTAKGLTVPADLLREVSVPKNANNVYLRPISDDIFLVNRQRGTNSNTVAYGTYRDGRVVINITTLKTLLGPDIRVGDSFVFSVNGSTANSLKVQLL